MERSIVILGLSRQPKLLGLPMFYTLAVGGLTMMPFIWTKMLSWLLTAPLWYLAARIASTLNPNGHRIVSVIFRKTPPSLSLRKRKEGHRYV